MEYFFDYVGFGVGGFILGAAVIWFFRRPGPIEAAAIAGSAANDLTWKVIAREQTTETIAALRSELALTRRDAGADAKGQREELSASLESVRGIIDTQFTKLHDGVAGQLDKMRATVDEKLQSTLDKRLGEAFKSVSDRLEQVHQGLGSMQQLAADVGGLQKVLTNVKTRGGWGEVQLGALLEQVLTADQFERNVKLRTGTLDRVDFAIKLPGGDAPVWLPIDAKFPMEDYNRLLDTVPGYGAQAQAKKALETQLLKCAKDISQKYVHPPETVDFAIMYLPTEGLFAEATRVMDRAQRDHRVVFAGPSTLMALLNSLQMGFRTLAIQQRSSEVWALLSGVKMEFGKFGAALAAAKEKLDQSAKHLDGLDVRTRAVEKSLRGVESVIGSSASDFGG